MLKALPIEERQRTLGQMEQVHLDLKYVIYWPGEPIRYVYFPINCVVSLLTLLQDGGAVETGVVGKEGMVGLPVFLGASSTPHRAICQIEGDAWRMRADTFREQVKRGSVLYELLLRYTQASMIMASQAAACNRQHPMEERAARWILMTQDRVGEASFYLTHEFISQMLGARRATVTVVMGTLQKAGLIKYARGHVTVISRQDLEAAACECYQVIADQFERLLGAPSIDAPSIDGTIVDGDLT